MEEVNKNGAGTLLMGNNMSDCIYAERLKEMKQLRDDGAYTFLGVRRTLRPTDLLLEGLAACECACELCGTYYNSAGEMFQELGL
jgi:hypothetical protein